MVPRPLVTATRPLRIYFDPQTRFDRKFGVDTCGTVEPRDLGVGYAADEEPGGYEATPRAAFMRIITTLALDYRRFTFVDLGSGRGAVLLYASEFPFKKIIGVEFAPALHEIAGRNLAAYDRRRMKCKDVRTVCIDAAAFPIPPEPAVLFLFNPFKGRPFAAVVENIERSLAACPREMIVIYYHTLCRHDALDRALGLESFRRDPDHTVYRPAQEFT